MEFALNYYIRKLCAKTVVDSFHHQFYSPLAKGEVLKTKVTSYTDYFSFIDTSINIDMCINKKVDAKIGHNIGKVFSDVY